MYVLLCKCYKRILITNKCRPRPRQRYDMGLKVSEFYWDVAVAVPEDVDVNEAEGASFSLKAEA